MSFVPSTATSFHARVIGATAAVWNESFDPALRASEMLPTVSNGSAALARKMFAPAPHTSRSKRGGGAGGGKGGKEGGGGLGGGGLGGGGEGGK